MQKQMKKWLILLMVLLVSIMTGCVSKQKAEKAVLYPRPLKEINEVQNPNDIKEYAKIIEQYDSYIQEWEVWGEYVITFLEIEGYDVTEIGVE